MNDQALTAERILDTAEEVLRRYGPAKATVIDVARALGVSHGSVYRHFPSKAALRDAVVERWLGRVSTPLGAIAMGAPEGAVLLGRLRPFVRHRRALPDLPAFLAREDLDGRLAHRSAAKERTSCASLQ